MFVYCCGPKKDLLKVFVYSIQRLISPATLGASIDGDNPDHILWILEKAQQRADEYGIQGINYRLVQGMLHTNHTLWFYHCVIRVLLWRLYLLLVLGVVKNIIPAVASTNAVIAGMYNNYNCCNQLFTCVCNRIASCSPRQVGVFK